MADRIKIVLVAQIAVALGLIVVGMLAPPADWPWAGVAILISTFLALPAWLLADTRHARRALVVDMVVWAAMIAWVVFRLQPGAGPGALLALPIVATAFALAEPVAALGMGGLAGLFSLASALVDVWSRGSRTWLVQDWLAGLLATLIGLGGTAAIAWLLARTWQRHILKLEQALVEGEKQAGERAARVAGLERAVTENAERLERLGEWSLPAIAVHDRIVVLPLGGYLDEKRAAQARRTLLHAISGQRAKIALIDVTNLPAVDAVGAAQLKTMIEAGQLLGAEVALVGIRPGLATSLIGSQVDVRTVCTHPDLPGGLDWALSRVGAMLGRMTNG